MDVQTNSGFIQWEIKKGDLVRVKHHIYHNHDNPIQYKYGIVVGEKHIGQLTLFPEIDGYMFCTKTTESFTAGSIEIISHA